MTSTTPKAVRWIRILLMVQIFFIFFAISSVILLAIIQPVDGYNSGSSSLSKFTYGYVSRMQAQPIGSTRPVFINNAPEVTGYMFSFVIWPALTLVALNKKKRKLFTVGAILMLLVGIANGGPLGVVSAIAILILRFRKSTKHYFAS